MKELQDKGQEKRLEQDIRKQVEDSLREREEHFRTTLYSIGDGVISTDKYGRIVDMNPVAEDLCGWTLADALGKPLAEIFKIINSDTGEVANDPVKKVLEHGQVVGMANHTLLISKDGTKYQISDSAAPIKNHKGDITGVVMVFSNVTTEYAFRERLRVSEERLNLAMMVKNEGLWDWDLTTGNTFFDDRYYTMAGYQPNEFSQNFDGWAENVHPEDLQASQNAIKAYLSGETDSFGTDFRFKRKDGSWMWIQGKGKIVERDANGVPLRMIGTHTDITDRKRVEEALRNSEEKHRGLIEQMLEGLVVVDKDDIIQFVNPAFCEMLGYQDNELIGKVGYEMLLNEAGKKLIAEKNRTREKGISEQYEINMIKKSGEQITLLMHASPVKEKSGKVVGSMSTCIDITGLKKEQIIQQILYNISNLVLQTPTLGALFKKVRNELQQLFDTTNFFVALYRPESDTLEQLVFDDEKDDIKEWKTSESLSGQVVMQAKTLLLNKTQRDQLAADLGLKLLGTPAKCWLGTPMKINDKAIGVVVIQSYDNENAYDENTARLLEMVARELSLFIERRNMLEDLVIAKEKAQESDRLKTAFLANMSHEIRTPMNSILGFSELLKNPQLTGDQKQRFIATIEKSGERMLNLISDIVDISKIESGQMEVFDAEINVHDSMMFLLDFFKPEFNKNKPDVQLRLKLPAQQTIISTDKEKLHSILINLIKNAEKFTHTGYVEFGFCRDGNMVEFFVKDTGIGIPKDKQAEVFKRFFQADSSLSSGYEGTGLGLSITKAFVELLGGEIWMESKPGTGSAFYFSLPAKVQVKPGKKEENTCRVHTKAHAEKKRKILVVEDDQDSIDLIYYMLDKKDFELYHVTTGEEAVKVFKENSDFDLILIDIKMPGIDGLEATRQIRQFNKEVPIIAQTAHALAGDREKAIEAGCDDYIAKPIKLDALTRMIHQYTG